MVTAADLDQFVIAQARRIAEEEIGGPPPRCTGALADRYNAAFNAVVKALTPAEQANGVTPDRLATKAEALRLVTGNLGASFGTTQEVARAQRSVPRRGGRS